MIFIDGSRCDQKIQTAKLVKTECDRPVHIIGLARIEFGCGDMRAIRIETARERHSSVLVDIRHDDVRAEAYELAHDRAANTAIGSGQ